MPRYIKSLPDYNQKWIIGKSNLLYYNNLLELIGYKIDYFPIINQFGKYSQLKQYSNKNIKICLYNNLFSIDSNFLIFQRRTDIRNEINCRLHKFKITKIIKKINLIFEKTNYSDYLISGENLDYPLPYDNNKTFRSKYINNINNQTSVPEKLTNICGVGIFIITNDDYIILSIHSSKSKVYPDRTTFTASGLMKWGEYPYPFNEILKIADRELNHQVNNEKIKLIGFGCDTRKYYYQFSFIEKIEMNKEDFDNTYEIWRKNVSDESDSNKPKDLKYIKLGNLDSIMNCLISDCWEPSAESCIINICIQKYGRSKVLKTILEQKSKWYERDMRNEWDNRASRSGDLPDMSLRYPYGEISNKKDEFIQKIVQFIGNDLNGKKIIEFGCGTGRVTEVLLQHAEHVTSIDLCSRMILKLKERVGNNDRLEVLNMFGQDYMPIETFDIAICVQVLLHNTDTMLDNLIKNICKSSRIVYVFEHIGNNYKQSNYTYLRKEGEISEIFKQYHFARAEESLYKLFNDEIVFLKFVAIN